MESSSLTRDRSRAPPLGAQSLSHWTTREIPFLCLLIGILLKGRAFFSSPFIYSFICISVNSRILISFTEPSSLFLWCTSCPWLCLWKSLLAGSCILVCPIILSALLYFVSQLAYTCLATSWNQPFLQGVLIPFNCLVGFRNQDLCSWCTHCIWSVTASKSSQLTETGNKCVCVCVCVCVYECTFLGQENALEEGMATRSSIFAWRIPMDRGAWQATVHRVAESDMTEAT